MFGRERKQPESSNPYQGLRSMALGAGEILVSTVPPDRQVLGMVVDIPSSGGTASLVALGDRTASLYTSTGGGTIGAGAHATVVAAVDAALRVLDANVEMFPPDDRTDLPDVGHVQVTLLTRDGRRRALVEADAFWGQIPSTIPEIIGAIQDVMTALREVAPS